MQQRNRMGPLMIDLDTTRDAAPASSSEKRHLTSLRAYLDTLRELGELQEIEHEVDWNLEIGAITRRCYEIGAPAPLFSRVKGVEPGFRVLGAPAGLSGRPGQRLARVAVSIGLPPSATALEIVEALARAEEPAPIPPRLVADAPCKRHVLTGDAVDLLRLPTPLIHGGDGGRYINTWGTIVARSPDGSWTNWSIARIMKLDGHRMTGLIMPLQDIGKIYRMWRERGEPMPFALAQGCEPAVPYICGMGLPSGVDEAGFLGAYFGAPLEIVRCRTVDLEVPA